MTPMRKAILGLIVLLVFSLIATGPGFGAESYPSKPIQVVIPFAAGGSSDLTGRALEKIWTKYSPQPMLIINKAGAGGVMGTESVVRAKPDGYTVYLGYGSGHDLVMPHLMKMPYDPFKDLAPVARVTIHAVLVCVSGKSKFNSMKDLLDWANKGNMVTAAVTVLPFLAQSSRSFIELNGDLPLTQTTTA